MKRIKPGVKKIIVALLIVAAMGGAAAWYLFTEKFTDTKKEKAAYTISALDLIKEFRANDSLANKKYAEQILSVWGTVTAIEKADTTVNIKLGDSTTGSYVIFAFQQQHLNEAAGIREGDKVTIKGSCSGGAYSQILEAEFITFKRCVLSK